MFLCPVSEWNDSEITAGKVGEAEEKKACNAGTGVDWYFHEGHFGRMYQITNARAPGGSIW